MSEAQLHPMGLTNCASCPHIRGIDDPEHECRPAHTPPPKKSTNATVGATTAAALGRPLSAPRSPPRKDSHVDSKHSNRTTPKAPAAAMPTASSGGGGGDRPAHGPIVELGHVGTTSAFTAPRQQRTRGRPARYQGYVDHDGFEAGGAGGAYATRQATPTPAAAPAAAGALPPQTQAWTGQPLASRWMAQNAKAAERRRADDALVREMRTNAMSIPPSSPPAAAAAAAAIAAAAPLADSPIDEKGDRYAADAASREAAGARRPARQPSPMFAAAAADHSLAINASSPDGPAHPPSPPALPPNLRASPIDPSASLPTPPPRPTPIPEDKSRPAPEQAEAPPPYPQYSHYPKMWEALPRSCIKPFIAVCRPHLESLHRAIRDNHSGPPGNTGDVTAGRLKQALDNVLAIPRACLTRIDGRPPTESLKDQISRFHSRYRADDPQAAVELASYAAAQAQAQAQRPIDNAGARLDDRTARRVEHRLHSGTRNAASRAASIPFQSGIAPPDSTTIARLHELHPAGSGPLPRMPSPAMCPVPTPEDISRLLAKGVACGSAPGPSGWTGELIRPLLDDDDCAAALTALVAETVAGRLPPSCMDALKATRCLPTLKAADPSAGIRPIHMPEAFYKLAGALPIHSAIVTKAVGRLFSSGIQLGLGGKGSGADVAVQIVQSAIECRPDTAVLSLDIRNAFNTRRRSDVARILYDHRDLSPIWPLFKAMYDRPITSFLYDSAGCLAHQFRVEEGVLQGDAMSQLTFDLSMEDAYQKVEARAAPEAAVAVHDDFTVVGTTESVAAAFHTFSDECASLGLQLSPNKCRVLWPRLTAPPPSALAELCKQTGMQLVTGRMELLGAMVGEDHAGIRRDLAVDTKRNHAPFFELLPRLTRQSALHLLRVCGIPRFNYLARAQAPDDLRPAAESFDESVSRALAHLLNAKPTGAHASAAAAANQAALPVSLGGLGLRRCTEVSPAAFYACALLAHRRNPALVKHRAEHERRQSAPPPPSAPRPEPIWAESIERAAAHLLTKIDDEQRQQSTRLNSVLFKTFAEFDEAVGTVPLAVSDSQAADEKVKEKSDAMRNAQRLITAAIEEKAARDLPTNDVERARLLALRQKGAGRWLTQLNTHGRYRLSDADVTQQLRLHLGLPPTDNDEHCLCGAPLTHGHAHVCLRLRKKCTETRHDTVVRAIARCASEAGLTVHVEPRPLHRPNGPRASRLRPDLLIEGPDVNVLADVVVTTPTAATYLKAGSARHGLKAAQINAQRKTQKYGEMARFEHRDLYPVAIESFGGMDEKARALINLIADRAAEFGGGGLHQRAETYAHIHAVIATAVVKGNTRLAEAAIRHARRPHRSLVRRADGGIVVELDVGA